MPKSINPRKITIINKKIDYYKIKINADMFDYFLNHSSLIYNNITFANLDLYSDFH